LEAVLPEHLNATILSSDKDVHAAIARDVTDAQ